MTPSCRPYQYGFMGPLSYETRTGKSGVRYPRSSMVSVGSGRYNQHVMGLLPSVVRMQFDFSVLSMWSISPMQQLSDVKNLGPEQHARSERPCEFIELRWYCLRAVHPNQFLLLPFIVQSAQHIRHPPIFVDGAGVGRNEVRVWQPFVIMETSHFVRSDDIKLSPYL